MEEDYWWGCWGSRNAATPRCDDAGYVLVVSFSVPCLLPAGRPWPSMMPPSFSLALVFSCFLHAHQHEPLGLPAAEGRGRQHKNSYVAGYKKGFAAGLKVIGVWMLPPPSPCPSQVWVAVMIHMIRVIHRLVQAPRVRSREQRRVTQQA